MCIAIHKPKGIKLPDHIYRECFSRQPHGGGFCYVGTNKKDKKALIIKKGFMEIEPMLKAIKEVEDLELVIHFRRASCGGVSKEMTHPFGFRSDLVPQYEFAMVHNGTLRYPNEPNKSDTACFVDDVLGPIVDRDPYFFDYNSSMFLLRAFLERNKFIIMRYDTKKDESKVYIINEKEGIKAHGCWFSNDSYFPIITHYAEHEHHTGGFLTRRYGGLPYAQCWNDGMLEKDYRLSEYGYWVRNYAPTVLGPDGKPVADAKAESQKTKSQKTMPERISKLTMIMRLNMHMKAPDKPHDIEIAAMPECIRKGKGTKYDFQGESRIVYSESEIAAMRIEYAEYIAKQDAETPPEDDDGKPAPVSLRHLTKSEKRELKRLCVEYLLEMGVDMKAMQLPEMVKWMRDDVRTNVKAMSDAEDDDIDRWVLLESDDIEVRYMEYEDKLEMLAEFDAEIDKAKLEQATKEESAMALLAASEGWDAN